MDVEQSAGAVVFYRGSDIEYLLVHSSYWGFPKGHIESGETERAAAAREVREETGLDVALLDEFREADEYVFQKRGELVKKQSVYFLGQATTQAAQISWEHDDLAWVSFGEALTRLKYPGGRAILERAEHFLRGKA
jgi:bis(5'-nucleosidyl)-tetraphosphatase